MQTTVKPKKNKNKKFEFDNTSLLLEYLDDQKRILPRRITELSIKNQRQLTKAVKRARVLGLLPFVVQAEY
jgi:small subunit ribosomal protein S18